MTNTDHSETNSDNRSSRDSTSNTTSNCSSSSMPPRSTSPTAPHSNGRHSPTHTTTKPDRITDFLARKHAELQTLLARFPIIPRFIAIGIAYCAVFVICMASLIVLFVGSFVLTGHDRVVARLRWLFELVRTRRDEGLAGRGLSLVWWLIRLAGDLVAAMVAATGAARTASTGPEHSAGTKTQHQQQQQQQNRSSSASSADREYRRRSTYASGTSHESTTETNGRRERPQSAYASYR